MDIRIDRVEKRFGTAQALEAVELAMASGELIGLLGPSGSGKTTLLRLIAGLERPSAGTIHFGGEDTTGMSVQERKVGFVFQHYALFRHMSVADNVAYGLRVRKRRFRPGEAEIARRVADLLELMQLAEYGRRFPAQLSGGQRQRVALARALAVEPRVLLLDEPFGALDAAVRRDLRSWLRALHDRMGHTSVFVTHDQDEALELSDRVAILNRGRLEQVGSPDAVYDTPATPFVFGFVGDSSRLPVMLQQGRTLLDGRDLGLTEAALPDGPAELFFRPADALALAEGVLQGTVLRQRRTGPIRRLELALGSGAITVEIDHAADRSYERGDTVALQIRRATVFSSDSPGRAAQVASYRQPEGVPIGERRYGR